MKVLVTGATGFIGIKLTNSLLVKGYKVTVLIRNKEKAKRLLDRRCEIRTGDITDRKSLAGCCKGIDVVIQLIAKVGNELPSDEVLEAFRKVNVQGLQNIVDEAKASGVKRFVSVSSIAAMGIVKDKVISEKSKCCPYLPYQVTKREGELLIEREYRENGLPGIIVRPTKVYGVGEKEMSFMQIIKLCKKGVFPKVGIKDTMVSHCYVDDLTHALTMLMEKGNVGNTYILTTEKSIGFYESVKMISELIDRKVTLIPVPRWLMTGMASMIEHIFLAIGKKPPVTRRNVIAATTGRVYDVSKAKNEIGYISSVTMEEGLRRVIGYYKDKGLI